MKVVVTGSNGFVGSGLVSYLETMPGIKSIVACQRNPGRTHSDKTDVCLVESLDSSIAWRSALNGATCVVHTAARVHILNAQLNTQMDLYREINVQGTLHIAQQAIDAGVKRFVFLSSIKVSGEYTENGSAFTENSHGAPLDAYSISKQEAEIALLKLVENTELQVVIVRPPLVYGPGVGANFKNLIKLVDSGCPLPLGSLLNKRSLVGLNNLCDFISLIITKDDVPSNLYLVSDNEDLSTPELAARIYKALGKKSRIIPFPVKVLEGVAKLAGKQDVVSRLTSSLQVDIQKGMSELEWAPKFTVDELLALTIRFYKVG